MAQRRPRVAFLMTFPSSDMGFDAVECEETAGGG